MARQPVTSESLNLNVNGALTRFNAEADNYISLQSVLKTGTWATAVLEVKASNDGVNFVSLPTIKLITGVAITVAIDCSAYAWVGVEVTTPEGGVGTITLTSKGSQFYPVDPFRTPINIYLQDSTSSIDAARDFSGGGLGTTEFTLTPAVDEIMIIHELIVSYADVKTLSVDKYGNNITLTNGILVDIKNGSGSLHDLLAGRPILSNIMWAQNTADGAIANFGTSPANEHLIARWDFTASGQPLYLHGAQGEYLAVTLDDDFNGLIEQQFLAHGYFK